jgi:hypothetical protein
LKKSGVYSIAWKYVQFCVGQIGRSIDTCRWIRRGGTDSQFVTPHPARGHQSPLHQMQGHGPYLQLGDWDWAAPSNMNRENGAYLASYVKPSSLHWRNAAAISPRLPWHWSPEVYAHTHCLFLMHGPFLYNTQLRVRFLCSH